jgi:hypothetical protein
VFRRFCHNGQSQYFALSSHRRCAPQSGVRLRVALEAVPHEVHLQKPCHLLARPVNFHNNDGGTP